MTYSDFTLISVQKAFGLKVTQERLFTDVQPVPPAQWLQETLARGMSLALVSEKARSEFIVAPILLTSRELSGNRFAIYSGQRLDVDASQGLTGECDFILTNTPPLPIIQSPIVSIVEAKKNDIESGEGQCVAQMIGAKLFNEKEGNPINPIFGCVTTGEAWQFLKLEDNKVVFDSRRYYINEVEMILGVWKNIVTCYQQNQLS